MSKAYYKTPAFLKIALITIPVLIIAALFYIVFSFVGISNNADQDDRKPTSSDYAVNEDNRIPEENDSENAPEESLEEYDIKESEIYTGFAIKNSTGDEIIISADHVEKIVFCKSSNMYGVRIVLNETGKNIFSEYSGQNIKKATLLCIDDVVLSEPIITEHITDGIMLIYMYDYDSAEDLFESLSI